jgi:hypothetical protein
LIAEAPEDRRFGFAEMKAQLQLCRDTLHARGPVGFGTTAEAQVALLPDEGNGHPLAVGFVYAADSQVHPAALLDCLLDGIRHCLMQAQHDSGQLEALPTAA